MTSGYYADAEWWAGAPPWERYAVCAAAKALRAPATIFCCEAAAFVHGLPLGTVPRFLTVAMPRQLRLGTHPRSFRPGDPAGMAAPRVFGHDHGDARRRAERVGDFTALPAAEVVAAIAATTGLETALPCVDAFLGWKGAGAIEQLGALVTADPIGTHRRQGLGVLALADPLSESPGESLSRAVLARLGIPRPVLQRRFVLPDGRELRADMYWPEFDVAGEFDGRDKYLDTEMRGEGRDAWDVVRAEKARDEHLRGLVRAVVHWTSEDLKQPQVLLAKLERAGVRADVRRRSRLR